MKLNRNKYMYMCVCVYTHIYIYKDYLDYCFTMMKIYELAKTRTHPQPPYVHTTHSANNNGALKRKKQPVAIAL